MSTASTASTASTTSISSGSAAANPFFNRAIFLLSLMGIIVAGLLWYWHAHPIDIPCGGTHSCRDVAQSRYATFPMGSDYPVAMYGFFGYLGIIVLAFMRTTPNISQTPRTDKRLLGAILLAGASGTLIALQLTYVEAFVLHAWCRWCVASQIIIFSIALLSGFELWQRRGSSLISSKGTVSH